MDIHPVRAAENAGDLFEAEGPDFVRCAYLTLLCRKPDPSGRASAEDFLRRGGRKIDLAWSIARSDEGRRLEVHLPGLEDVFRRRLLGNLPLAGWLLRPILGLERLGAVHRQQRAISFAITKMNDVLGVRLHRLESELAFQTKGNDFRAGYDGPGHGYSTVRSSEILKSLQARLD